MAILSLLITLAVIIITNDISYNRGILQGRMVEKSKKYRTAFRHNKTGHIYYVEANALNTTNALDGDEYVIYRTDANLLYFVREKEEFLEKFTKVDDEEIITNR